ncbi:MAG: DNA-directed RNA polymerase subunit omega [Bdellovibrionota bacterium]
MARVTIEDCLDKEQNRFRLVHLAIARTKQLLSGSTPLYECDNKSVVTALREVAAGLVRFKTPEECEADRLVAENKATESKVAESEQEKARKALDSLFEDFSQNNASNDEEEEIGEDELLSDDDSQEDLSDDENF